MSKISLFAVAVARHWKAFLTGSSPVAALFVYQSTGHSVSPWVYWIVVFFGVLVASFKAWEDQFTIAEAERAKNLKPQINGEVLHARFAGCTETSQRGGPLVPTSFLLFRLGLTNGNGVDTTIKDVSLVVEMDGLRYECRREEISRSLVVFYSDETGNHQLAPPQSLIGNITYENPIRYQKRSEGWVQFAVPGLGEQKHNFKADLTFTITDALDYPHTFTLKSQLVHVGG